MVNPSEQPEQQQRQRYQQQHDSGRPPSSSTTAPPQEQHVRQHAAPAAGPQQPARPARAHSSRSSAAGDGGGGAAVAAASATGADRCGGGALRTYQSLTDSTSNSPMSPPADPSQAGCHASHGNGSLELAQHARGQHDDQRAREQQGAGQQRPRGHAALQLPLALLHDVERQQQRGSSQQAAAGRGGSSKAGAAEAAAGGGAGAGPAAVVAAAAVVRARADSSGDGSDAPQAAASDSEDDSWTPEQPQSSSGEQLQQPAGVAARQGSAAGDAPAADADAAGGPGADRKEGATDTPSGSSGGDGDDGSDAGDSGSDAGDGDEDADAGSAEGGPNAWDAYDADGDLAPLVYCTNCTGRMYGSGQECMDCGHHSDQDSELLRCDLLGGGGGSEPGAAAAAAAEGERAPEAQQGQQAAAPAPAAAGAAEAAAQPVIIWDEGMLLHEEGRTEPHPERPDRLRAIMARLSCSGLAGRCRRVPARPATKAELLRVHTPDHLTRLQLFCSGAVPPSAIPSDTYINAHTLECAALAAGSAAEAALRVWRGESDRGAAIIRPPGHHAESNTAMGFCFFNNAAVAARAAQAAGAERVLILDWDVHHGNGTQHIFEDDPSVLYMSLHRYDRGTFYPGTGSAHEVGLGRGAGFTVNVPWDAPAMGDGDYMAAMEQVLLPIASEFAPDLILISAGFDAAAGDPIGGCCLTPACFGAMAAALLPVARTVLLLEGGYNLRATAAATEACLRVLLGEPAPELPPQAARPSPFGWLAIRAARKAHSRYWSCLAGAFPAGAEALQLQQLAAGGAAAAGAGWGVQQDGDGMQLQYSDEYEEPECEYGGDDDDDDDDDESGEQEAGEDGSGDAAGAHGGDAGGGGSSRWRWGAHGADPADAPQPGAAAAAAAAGGPGAAAAAGDGGAAYVDHGWPGSRSVARQQHAQQRQPRQRLQPGRHGGAGAPAAAAARPSPDGGTASKRRRLMQGSGSSGGGSLMSGAASGSSDPSGPLSRKQQMLRAIHSKAMRFFWQRRLKQQQQQQQQEPAPHQPHQQPEQQ